MINSNVAVALRELEIVLVGYQGVEAMAGEGTDSNAASSAMIPLNIFFEERLKLLNHAVREKQAIENNNGSVTSSSPVDVVT